MGEESYSIVTVENEDGISFMRIAVTLGLFKMKRKASIPHMFDPFIFISTSLGINLHECNALIEADINFWSILPACTLSFRFALALSICIGILFYYSHM